MGYTRNAIVGITWVGLLRVVVKALGFVEMLILARILNPSQFGAFGVALLILGLLEVLTESGVNIILVQESSIDKFLNSAWIISIIRGLFIALLILVSAPFVANFFHSPESLQLLLLISIVPILRGLLNPSIVKFQKNLQFRKDFLFQVPMVVVDTGVSITVTFLTKSPIGIVIGLISGVVVELIMSFLMVKPVPRFQLEREYIFKVFHRGVWITASGFFNYLFQNVDNIVVGRILGPSALGVYQIAYSFAIVPVTEISDVFSRVTFPVYTKISADKKRLLAAFMKVLFAVSLITITYGSILGFFPHQIVLLALGNKWLAAVVILPILALFGVLRAVGGSATALFLAIGKQEYVTIITFISIFCLVIPIIPLVYRYGMIGAAIAALFATVVTIPLILYFTVKVFKKNM